jgi:hypothetical protein
MLKPLLVASAFLSVFTIQAEARAHHRHHGHRAHAWCGSYLSKYLGKPDRRLALARSWANEGMNAGGPGIGVVVVWSHHVGIITGQTPDGQWIVHSGNDGGAVVRAHARLPARLRSGACSEWRYSNSRRHCEPTGRANARPMTGSAKQSTSLLAALWIASLRSQ